MPDNDLDMYLAFSDELQKVAASKHRMAVPQTRSGRRSMRVDTLLRKDRDGTLFKRWHDRIPGGLADKKKPQDFAPKALVQGQKVESEHTSSPAIATEIAMDHLTEDPKYYPKLEKMEAKTGAAMVTDDLKNFESRLKPGDILLTRAVHPTMMSRIVSAVQHSEFGHSSIYAGNGKVIDTRTDKGVFETTLPEVYKKWGGGREIRAYRPKIDAEARHEAIEKAKDFIGTPYDMKGALRLLLPAGANKGLDDAKKKAVICSQVVIHAYPHLNFAASKNRDHVLPADIANSPLTKRVAELKQKVAFKLQGHTTVQGLPVSIENLKGSVRKGVDPDGKPWKTVFKLPYGYIPGTKGNDGEEIDVYVGPHKKAPNAFVIHQRKITGKGFDEDKVMLGFDDIEEARKFYLEHYNKVGPKLLGPITTITVDELKRRLDEKREHKKLATVDISNTSLYADRTGPQQPKKPNDIPDAEGSDTPTSKLAWDGVGSGAGPLSNAMARIDQDEKPDRRQKGDVPSRDGTSPGQAVTVKHEAGPDFAATVPTAASISMATSSESGPTTRM